VLIAIEGVDGAGKRTLAQGLQSAFEGAGKEAKRVVDAVVAPSTSAALTNGQAGSRAALSFAAGPTWST